jgi:RNA polymerase sigma factor (TIGR02999 family)
MRVIPAAAVGSVAAAIDAMPLASPASHLSPDPQDRLLALSQSVILYDMSDVTRILSAIEQGDPRAAEQLLPLVYDELRKLAAQKMVREASGHTFQATALVHEAYLRLVDVEQAQHWNGRGHFFAAAAEAMRRILVENARRKRRPKHGGDRQRIELDEMLSATGPRHDLLALDEALTQLATREPVKAELVKLRYFAGLSLEEAAACLAISPATAKRYWAVARAWLFAALSDPDKSAAE